MNGNSTNITEAKLAALREVLPEAFAEGELDWEKLRVMLTPDGEFADERYHLNWAGKTDAYRALQAPTSAMPRARRTTKSASAMWMPTGI